MAEEEVIEAELFAEDTLQRLHEYFMVHGYSAASAAGMACAVTGYVPTPEFLEWLCSAQIIEG